MTLYYREHEIGTEFPEMRVWTEQDAAYGSFVVMTPEDFAVLKALCEKYGWTLIKAHN